MQRQIKFNLWNIKEKRMYHFEPSWGNFGYGGGWVGGVPLDEYERNGRTFAPSNQIQLEPEGCEWLQFTGLTDRLGKEIYEGDIVAQKDLIIDDIISVVKWGVCDAGSLGDDKIPMSGWVLESNQYDIMPLAPYPKWYEVIGNIWENGDLIK